MVAAPSPVSELVTTRPPHTTGFAAPSAPVNGDRYPASSTGASAVDLVGVQPDVHPPLGQVAAVDLDGDPGPADAVQDRGQHVQVIDPLVPVRQQRPRHPGPGLAAEAADQEPAAGVLAAPASR